MTLSELIKFLWNGVDIPLTKDEIQHSVNVAIWAAKRDIVEDKEVKQCNDLYNKSKLTLNNNIIN